MSALNLVRTNVSAFFYGLSEKFPTIEEIGFENLEALTKEESFEVLELIVKNTKNIFGSVRDMEVEDLEKISKLMIYLYGEENGSTLEWDQRRRFF